MVQIQFNWFDSALALPYRLKLFLIFKHTSTLTAYSYQPEGFYILAMNITPYNIIDNLFK